MSGWLSVEDAAKRVGKSPETIYRWIRRGWLTNYSGKVIEAKLLDVASKVRAGRPRKTQ